VTVAQYRYTLGKILELSGWRNTESFFTDPAKMAPEALAAMLQKIQQMKAQAAGAGAGPTGPDPQVEMAKIASHEKIAQAKIQHDTEMKNLELQTQLHMKQLELWANHQTTISHAEIQAAAKAASDHVDAATKLVLGRMKDKGDTERVKHTAQQKGTND
jgi:hypothetical protein